MRTTKLTATALAALALAAAACDKAPPATGVAPDVSGLDGIPSSIDPRNRAALGSAVPLVRGHAMAEGLSLSLNPLEANSAILNNGTIRLGIAQFGNLNVASGDPSFGGTSDMGVRFMPSDFEATAPGCLCEGWGAADAAGPQLTGFANKAAGTSGVTFVSITSPDATHATTVTDIGVGSASGKRMRVTHEFRPSTTLNLIEMLVTIQNTGTVPIGDLRYRRTMDWDVEPTPFNEFSTIAGVSGASSVIASSNNGFASSNPLVGAGGTPGPFVDLGPTDHGANFDFGFGALAVGASTQFRVFYGAAATEAAADLALKAVGAEVWSFGQPNVTGGATIGAPVTFIFAFAGVGGVAVNNPPAPAINGPGTGAVGASLAFTTGATDPDGDAVSCSIGYTGPAGGAPAGGALASCGSGFSASFSVAGSYVITLTATDAFGLSATATKSVVIAAAANTPPNVFNLRTATAGPFPIARLDCYARAQFCLRWAMSDPDNGPWTVNIDWGDGSPLYTSNVQAKLSTSNIAWRRYSAPGTYVIKVRATDALGATDVEQITVVIL